MKSIMRLIAVTALLSSAAYAAPGGNGVVPRVSWQDSYSANGRCYISSSNFDHGIGEVQVDTPIGRQSVRQVAAKIGSGPGRAGNPIYNDVQCGNGPANDAGDEDYDQCPGRVDQGASGCSVIGPKWDLELAYGNTPTLPPITPTTTFNLQKQNTNFSVDGDHGGVQGKQVYLWDTKASNVNQQWDQINRGGNFYSYRKQNTTMCLDGGEGGARLQAITLELCNDNNQDQHWKKVKLSIGSELYRMEKRNSPGFSIDGDRGGSRRQGLYLWNSSNSNVNQQWEFTSVNDSLPTTAPTPEPTTPAPVTPAPTRPAPTTPTTDDTCDATGADLGLAITAYAAKCSLPRKDCDPVAGGYKCASYTIGNQSPVGGTEIPTTTPTTTTPTTPAPAPTAGTIRIEAESQLGAGWVNRGDHIEFNNPDSFGSVTYGSLVYSVNIPAAGDWELRWRAKAARQTSGRSDLHNDAWAKMNGNPISGFHDVRTFRKVFSPGNGNWHIAGTAEIGSHNFSKFRQRFTPGNYQLEISGRSIGYAIDYIEFVQINGATSTPSPSVPTGGGTLDPLGGATQYLDTFNQPYVNGDLLSLHWDSAPDPDDLQAMILTREILDSRPEVDFIAVNGAKRDATSSLVTGSSQHMKSMFPSAYEAFQNGLNGSAQTNLYNSTVRTVATAWELTLASGNRVHVAEGGPSNFTASVIDELLARNTPVSSLKNIRVVQHSWGWNEDNTNDDAFLTVRRYADYIRIANGNHGDGSGGDADKFTPDYSRGNDARCQAFRARTQNSTYSAQWAYATSRLINRCDGSDAVEVLWILGISTSLVPTLEDFADRYF